MLYLSLNLYLNQFIIKLNGEWCMDVSKEIALICDVLDISESDLAKELKVSLETINNWKNNIKSIDYSNLNKLYDFAYKRNIVFNDAFEQLLKQENDSNKTIVLFHGTRNDFEFPIDINKNSRVNNDFGIGFYLGETFKQACAYVSSYEYSKVLAFKLNFNNKKSYRFNVDTEWMLAIAYFRGWLDDYKESDILNKILKKIEKADIIIAPIADNRMFDIISDFSEGSITDLQCQHSLAATNLGYQYVLKTKKAIDDLEFLKEMFVSNEEKQNIIKNRFEISHNGLNKAKMARIEYRGKGKYIEELLK